MIELKDLQLSDSTLSDREVVNCVLEGETHLFELLMRRYNQRLFRVARSIIKDRSEAEDVMQEAYVIAYTHLDSFRGERAGAWLAKITMNEALGRLRKRSNKLQSLSGVFDSELATLMIDSEDKNMQQISGPEASFTTHETLGLIEAAIDCLPGQFRVVFVLRAIEQLSVNETAEYLGIKPATVKTRFFRARALLRDKLTYKLEETSVNAFTFGGQHCDGIVKAVFERLVSL